MESIQGERRDDNATPDAYVPAVLSDAGTESQTVEARCKRRRLGSEFEVQRHLDRGPQVGISLVGQPGHDAQVQSDAAADLRRDSIPSGTTCSSWTYVLYCVYGIYYYYGFNIYDSIFRIFV